MDNCAKCKALQRYGTVFQEIQEATNSHGMAAAKAIEKSAVTSVLHAEERTIGSGGSGSATEKAKGEEKASVKSAPSDSKKLSKAEEKKKETEAAKDGATAKSKPTSPVRRHKKAETDSGSNSKAKSLGKRRDRPVNGVQHAQPSTQGNGRPKKKGRPETRNEDSNGKAKSGAMQQSRGEKNRNGGGKTRVDGKRERISPRIESYSSSEQREIYDAVQSLQILAKRTASTCESQAAAARHTCKRATASVPVNSKVISK